MREGISLESLPKEGEGEATEARRSGRRRRPTAILDGQSGVLLDLADYRNEADEEWGVSPAASKNPFLRSIFTPPLPSHR